MTQVVTISATTAAYAAEALKPSARVSGVGPADEAITLLSVRRQGEAVAAPAAIPKTRSGTLPASLMLISADLRLPQETEIETLRRYLEYMRDEESDGQREEQQEEQPAEGGHEESGEIAAMLDRFIRGE
ncbi:hypothetical protein [Sinorhizobium saheli]|uniref:Uncharacterized protein n=1 Tax=Sinorhizobium saheli TaxID=36856 RepID=A0A178YND1_SINSA|nr:hypothetical protein [Sinorhizobium saheli]MQW88315.1 hypothetical protein [Sinorhizobium saheli]OAP48423.1 hypothetical protein ATB98_24030 [Sinorhizobium saheli]